MQRRLMRTCASIRTARDKKKKAKLIKPSPTPKDEEINVREGAIVILGVPKLDIIVNVDPEFLIDHEIGSKDILDAEEKHNIIFEGVHDMKPKPKYEGGGSALNSARVIQAILRKPNVSVFFGSLGKDENAGHLQEAIRYCGVNMALEYFPNDPTAASIYFVTGLHRAVLTKNGAGELLSKEFLEDYANNEMLCDGDIYYTTATFMSFHAETCLKVMEMAVNKCKVVAFYLNCPQAVMKNFEQIEALMPHIDILFGSESAFTAFAIAKEWECSSIKAMLLLFQSMPKTSLRPRLVVMTRSALPIIVVNDWTCQEYPVKILRRSEIIDINGCGDAFVGGFLSQFVQHMPLHLCIRCGIWAATLLLQREGCNLKAFPNYKKSCK